MTAPRVTRRQALGRLLAGAGALAALPTRSWSSQASGEALSFPKGSVIRTVLEDVPPERITGATLIHEHLSMGKSAWGPDRPGSRWYDDLGLMADEVKACAADGVSCIVDTGTADLGRRIDALRTIASRSGMLIVASGGLHAKDDYPPDVAGKSADQIANDFQALAASERWGAIGEMGTGTAVPMDAQERKVLQAAAKVQRRTGLPIITHVSDGCAQCALEQVDLFEASGVPLNRVVIGHLNDIKDNPARVPLAIAKRGAYVGFDHSGKPDDPRIDEYPRTIMALLEAGFVDRVCLSSDFGAEKYLRARGGPGIDMLMTTMVPRLRKAGVDEKTIHRILVDNPRRVLAFVPRHA